MREVLLVSKSGNVAIGQVTDPPPPMWRVPVREPFRLIIPEEIPSALNKVLEFRLSSERDSAVIYEEVG